jgi:hypothetical protein
VRQAFALTNGGQEQSVDPIMVFQVQVLPVVNGPLRSVGDVVRPQVRDDLAVVVRDIPHNGGQYPQKARILLMLALTKTRNASEIARIFATY